ncbi:hypothetical protein [Paenibacillus terrae]|uniref:hypothetical protein n=1 Tax=Paenibacillus terrae TaxID=159743 RepID=UPI0016568711|nr:hypothetical protein [Paenibacillus terrae]
MFAAVMNAEDSSNFSAKDSLDSHMVYTTVPDSAELERQEQYKLETPKAWVEDVEGNTKEVPYIVPNSDISTQSWSDSNFTYVFNRFVMDNYKKDPKRFFIDDGLSSQVRQFLCERFVSGFPPQTFSGAMVD